jgi:hypothetical protein
MAAGTRSPCKKSRRGVVICSYASLSAYPTWYAIGTNGPPDGRCRETQLCRDNCRRVCTHAEIAALRKLPTDKRQGDVLYHVKVDDHGAMVPTGGPSCVECATALQSSPVVEVWLYQRLDGVPPELNRVPARDAPVPPNVAAWVEWPMARFYQATMEANGLGEWL